MRFVRHLVVGLSLIAVIVLIGVALSLYDPLSGGRRFLDRSELITASRNRDFSRLVTGEAPIEVTDPPKLAALALRYQPTVVVSSEDRFWPVSVLDALRFRFDGHQTCLYAGGRCRVRA